MKRITYSLALLLSLMLLASTSSAQKALIDSLKNVLRNSPLDTNRVKTLNNLAFVLRISDLAATEQYRKEAQALSTQLKYASGIAWAYYLEGVIYTYQNKLMRSINSLTVALDLATKAKDYELVVRIHNGIGLNNLRLEDDYNAMKAFENGLVAIRLAADKGFEAALLHNIASLYVKNKRFDEAIKRLKQSIALNLKNYSETGLALNYKEMGLAYSGIGDYQTALDYGNKALDLSKETDFILNEINSLSLLGMVYLKLGRPSIAKSYFDEAHTKAMPNNPQREKLLIYTGYADYYSVLGNFKQALKYQNLYQLVYDSLYTGRRSKLILEYQEKFKAQQKEAENKGLRIEQTSTENQIKQRNQVLMTISGLLVVFVIFSVLIFWGTARIKGANKLLVEQKNEIEIRKNNVDHLNSIKDKLFSVIAHDLRTPFSSLKSMMDMYDEGAISKNDVSYFFKEIRRDIGSNTLLLDNLLIWAKSQLGGFKVEEKVLAMEKVVDEIVSHHTPILESKQLKVINRLDDFCIVLADYEMTKTIVRNLIGNAMKFTPPSGNIVVAYVKVEGYIQISVTDSGIGMSEETKGMLFLDSFFTTQGLNKEKGTGLGLQICKEFVEKNNGKIWVESEVNKGSSFWFSLPESKKGIEYSANAPDMEGNEKETLSGRINLARLQNTYDRYELWLKASNDTIWDWDFTTGVVIWNEALQSNFGYALEKTPIGWWSERVHPDDLDTVVEEMDSAIHNNELNFQLEYNFRCADDSYKYVYDRGVILYEDGKATRALGVIHNMESDKNAVREIKRLSVVATHVNNLVVITDGEGEIVWVNRAFESLTGYKLSEIVTKDLHGLLFGPATSPDAIELVTKSVSEKQGFEVELINYGKSGEPYWVHVNSTPYNDPVSGQIGFISIHTIVSDRKTNEKQMIDQNEALREIARITSHEVRSPLSSILGLVNIMKGDLDVSEREECISLLEESAKQLDTLIHRINNHLIEIDKQEYEDA
ncbi:ATP-binding protein [Daejeonella sp.]|uniref:ATP-binding protein n=1 Tax=Daejeonella sp. TaxID=2805397 RepID=UPI0030BF638B